MEERGGKQGIKKKRIKKTRIKKKRIKRESKEREKDGERNQEGKGMVEGREGVFLSSPADTKVTCVISYSTLPFLPCFPLLVQD